MRMCEWKPENIRFSRDASEHSDYFRNIADLIAIHLKPGMRVCDAGCGLGYLSLELARRGMDVTAIDRSPDAMRFLEGDLLERDDVAGLRGCVHPITGTIEDNPPAQPYDAMIFCTSRHLEDAIGIARRQCAGTLVVIEKLRERSWETGGSVRMTHCQTGTSAEAFERLEEALGSALLDARPLSLRFDQSFAGLDDARMFFWMYRNDSYPQGVDDEELLASLQMTDNSEWPLRLPIVRHLGMAVMDVAAITEEMIRSLCHEDVPYRQKVAKTC